MSTHDIGLRVEVARDVWLVWNARDVCFYGEYCQTAWGPGAETAERVIARRPSISRIIRSVEPLGRFVSS